MVTAPMGDLREGQDGCQVPKSLKGSGGAVRTQERIRWARSKGIEARHVTWKALYSSFLFCFFFFRKIKSMDLVFMRVTDMQR